jgi:hypothetical protein
MSDYDVECMYLGKPFADDMEADAIPEGEPVSFSEEEIERLFLGFPLLAA